MDNHPERRRALRPRRRRASSENSEREAQARHMLQSLGMEADVVDTTVKRVRRLGDDPVDWLMVGLEAGIARGAVESDRTRVRSRELARLMEGFSNELIKLDEVVDVLATFVSRMRRETEREADPEEIVH